MGALLARGFGQLGRDGLAGQLRLLDGFGDSFASLAFCSGVAGASIRVENGVPNSAVSSR